AGGQLATLYPEKYIYDMPGFPKVLAGELAEMMLEQATMHRKQHVEFGFRVVNLQYDPEEDLFHVHDGFNNCFMAKTVWRTTGAGAYRPNRQKVENIGHLEGRSVHYFVKDKSIFKDKQLVIVGGGDSALDWVLNLHEDAAQVSL